MSKTIPGKTDSNSNTSTASPDRLAGAGSTGGGNSSNNTGTNIADLKSLMRKPGDMIRSEDWNRLVSELASLRDYVNNMGESMTLTGLSSSTGQSFDLDTQNPPGYSYGVSAAGLITKQWVAAVPVNTGEVCAFGVTDYFETMQFWAGADNGDKNALDVIFEYIDGTTFKAGDKLFVNNRPALSARDPSGVNPYLEFLKMPYGIWYKYQLRNRFPDKEVRFVRFINTNKECVPRIGNVLHMRSKIKPMV